MDYLTYKKFEKKAMLFDGEYWKSYKERWGYIAVVVEWLSSLNPATVLEAGSYGVGICDQSTTMDIRLSPDVKHDMRKTPWPFDDHEFDVFVALQVFEHLQPNQTDAFSEAMRVAKNVIISVPYKWRHGSPCHHNIDDAVVNSWTGGAEPVKSKLIGSGKRKIYHFSSDGNP